MEQHLLPDFKDRHGSSFLSRTTTPSVRAREEFADRLANVVSWLFCVTNAFPSIEVNDAASRKFPSGHCPYCGKRPCTECGENRPPHKSAEVDPHQLSWSVSQWQDHFRELYAKKNATSRDSPTERLSKEVTEILAIDMGLIDPDASLETVEAELGAEFADVLAWTIAVANED